MAGRDGTFRISIPHLPVIELSIKKNLARTKPGDVCMFKEKIDGTDVLVIIANRVDGATITLISKHGVLQL